jgi:tryptophanyl-tRNA synthetase
MNQRVLTGITTTGTPHLGNYVGAIRPAIQASQEIGVESFLFLADYHALIKCADPARIERSRLEIAATWLACGLDPQRVTFYRQSDIPEITELNWLLTCLTAKGQMNRAHAYKAQTDINAEQGQDIDAGVTMGLYCYPILMAADILLFNAHRVPVGRDQVQHIEMARDVAQRFNHSFGHGQDVFVLPEAQIEEDVATLPGLDGRKMSKSYDNIISLFEGGTRALADSIARIVTDSRLPGEPKNIDNCALVTLHDAFASPEQRAQFHADLSQGMGWGEAKKITAQRIELQIAPMRDQYAALMSKPAELEAILQEGAAKARQIATPFMADIRQAVGLKSFVNCATTPPPSGASASSHKTAAPVFKQYRESDGLFYFKLTAADGVVLLQSHGFEQGREAGAWVKRLKTQGPSTLADIPSNWYAGVPADQLTADLQTLQALENEAAQ